MSVPLLMTKLYIPPIRPELVPRPRLVEALDAAFGPGVTFARKLTLVSAPAGFGKTTLLGEWAASREADLRIAWLSLDLGDNDPARFLAYLSASLQAASNDQAEGGAPTPGPSTSLSPETMLTALINHISVRPGRLVLCLDDYHLITVQAVHDALAFLLDHMPDNMHIAIATRSDPPVSLARLRARGHLTELRQTDLRFTAGEAAAFLTHVTGLDLMPEDVAALESRTEGWIAGLQMAALAMRGATGQDRTRPEGAQSVGRFVQAFTGSNRFILDYLMEEVLDQQPPSMQEFLLRTSVLERLTGSLCDAVLADGGNGQQMLERLEHANLFVVPLDEERRWYRYHRLFSDLLRKRLRQTLPDIVAELHRRASEWHEVQGLMASAIEHALASGNLERAANLIEENVEATLMRSEVATFLHWVQRLPTSLVRARPNLCFYHAWALLMSGRSLDAVEEHLEAIACVREAAEADKIVAGRMAALQAYMLLFQGDTYRAAELCEQALEKLPESDLFLRNVVLWILSLVRLFDGGLQNGIQALAEVVRMSQDMGNPLIAVTALCYQAKLQVRQGRLHQAREILERALQMATDSEGRRLPIASEALIGLGELEREWNELSAAADHLTESIELAKRWSELAAFDAYFPLARVRLAQGNVEAARKATETSWRMALESEITEVDDLVAGLQRAFFAISQGDAEGATRWAQSRGLALEQAAALREGLDGGRDTVDDHLRKYELVVLARLFILQERPAEALDILEPLLALARQLGRIDLSIEVLSLRALAFQAQGRDVQAVDALGEALSLAEPGGHVRAFLDHGEAMSRLLRLAASHGIAPAYVASLLAAFEPSGSRKAAVGERREQAQPLVEPLSDREMEVLRLLASGLSNPEIADELVVAVSTVRSHCKSIYGKLNVHKRWDAVQRAQELGLI